MQVPQTKFDIDCLKLCYEGDISIIIQMDADFDPSQAVPTNKKKKKKSKLAQALSRKKPAFNPGKIKFFFEQLIY